MEVEEVLYDGHSKYQHIQVFKTKQYGVALVLDGVVQATERDEFTYQEMMTHVPLMSHPNPRKVLVIGGGDGGCVREIVKHPSVESVTLCEIDEEVVNVATKYLPSMAVGFQSPKCNVVFGDGCDYMRTHQGEFDVIITDSSDPIGPAEVLFTESYYTLMRQALTEGGICCCQGECVWLHTELIINMLTFNTRLYPVAEYAYVSVPTYPGGQIGLFLCSKDPKCDFRSPRSLGKEGREWGLRYYSTDMHRAAFVLPQFVRQRIDQALKDVPRFCQSENSQL